jgi:hypothetical protein
LTLLIEYWHDTCTACHPNLFVLVQKYHKDTAIGHGSHIGHAGATTRTPVGDRYNHASSKDGKVFMLCWRLGAATRRSLHLLFYVS